MASKDVESGEKVTRSPHVGNNYDSDSDAVLEQLEKEIDDEFDMGAFREQRMEELRREMQRINDMRNQEHGKLTEVRDEKEVIKISANEKRCVVHFFHRDFKRCEIMNKHLEVIAPKYFKTRFLRVFVENVPWLVEKLSIKVLPCVVCFIDGVTKHRLVGFEELGNNDAFDTATLELRLQLCGVIEKPEAASKALSSTYEDSAQRQTRRIRQGDYHDDSDSDG